MILFAFSGWRFSRLDDMDFDVDGCMQCFLNVAAVVLDILGLLALPLIIASAMSMRLSYAVSVSITPKSLAVIKLFSRAWVMYLMSTGLVHLSLTLAHAWAGPWFDPTLIEKLGLASATGGVFFLCLVQQGFSIPLGSGLTLTMDRAPKLGHRLSPFVLSFHVDRYFLEKRWEVTQLIAKTVNDSQAAGNHHDFVLKSWMFARRGVPERYVQRARRRMSRIRHVLRAAFLLLAISVVAIFLVTSDIRLIELWLWLCLAAAVLVACLLIWAVWSIRRVADITCLLPKTPAATSSVNKLSNDLSQLAAGYSNSIIGWRPLPSYHIFAIGALKPEIVKLCAGTEAGVVMKRI